MHAELRRALRRFAALATGLLASTAGFAAEYSWQVSGAAHRVESGDVLEGDGDAFDITYYFRPVNDQVGPYTLAPFLNRSSRLSAAFHREEQTETRILAPGQFYVVNLPVSPLVAVSRIETQGYALSGRHVWRDSGWYAGGGYRGGGIDTPAVSLYDSDVDVEGYGLLAGKYLGRTTALELTLNAATTTSEITTLSCINCPARFETEVDSDDAGVAVLHVGLVGRFSYSLTANFTTTRTGVSAVPLTLAATSPVPQRPPFGIVGGIAVRPVISEVVINAPSLGRSRMYSLAGELYPTARLGVRLGYGRWEDDPLQDDRFGISATWFANSHVALHFSFERRRRGGPLSFPDIDDATLRLIGRF